MPRLLVMTPESAECWALLPYLFERIEKMAVEFGGGGYGDRLVATLKAAFACPGPKIRAWVATGDLQHNVPHVLGHAVATIEKDGLGDYCLVWQAKTDFPMPSVSRATWDDLLEWSHDQNARRVVVAARGGRALGMAKRYGFTESYVVLTKFLDKG
jgi:hypothetical protein